MRNTSGLNFTNLGVCMSKVAAQDAAPAQMKVKFKSESSKLRRERIRELLSVKSMSAQQLADAVFLHIRSVRLYIKALRAERTVYIKYWEPYREPAREPTAFYGWSDNPTPDAEPPAILSQAEHSRLFRVKVNADPERRDRYIALRKARRLPIVRDYLVSALFGGAA
jgi:hypothetical protein